MPPGVNSEGSIAENVAIASEHKGIKHACWPHHELDLVVQCACV